ncbi:MAG: hypothetical protein ACRC92_08075 [Peptostreptococcaceae bacterium]
MKNKEYCIKHKNEYVGYSIERKKNIIIIQACKNNKNILRTIIESKSLSEDLNMIDCIKISSYLKKAIIKSFKEDFDEFYI